jgi:hypothetical protein
MFTDPFGLCPECLVAMWTNPVRITLANNQTWDKVSPNLRSNIELAARISFVGSVGVSWTTGGTHDASSRHYPAAQGGVGKAADIYSLNGSEITAADPTGVVGSFQAALNVTSGARENFGPARMDKLGKPYCTSGSPECKKLIEDHKDHVHYSVNQ